MDARSGTGAAGAIRPVFEPRGMCAETAQPYLTLQRAALFLGAANYPEREAGGSARTCRAKALGNHLRELDRFLRMLIDAIARSSGLVAVRGIRGTAGKLAQLDGGLANSAQRLNALRRSRNCLFYCGGWVRHGDRRGAALLTTGWPSAQPRQLRLGEELTLSVADLREICGFYLDIADRLVANAGRGR